MRWPQSRIDGSEVGGSTPWELAPHDGRSSNRREGGSARGRGGTRGVTGSDHLADAHAEGRWRVAGMGITIAIGIHMERNVKTVQMTLDEALVARVDKAARKLGTTRSGFTRNALKDALSRLREQELERRQREGYERQPVADGEFDAWLDEQAWPV